MPISCEISGRLIGQRLLTISKISTLRFSFSVRISLCRSIARIRLAFPRGGDYFTFKKDFINLIYTTKLAQVKHF